MFKLNHRLKSNRAETFEIAKAGSLSVRKPVGWKLIILALSAAIIINGAIVLVAIPRLSPLLAPTYSLDFGDLYNLIAHNLDQGNGYRVDPAMGQTMLREPGYPFLLAGAFELGGYSIQTARLVCVLLAFGAAFMLLELTRKITGDQIAALVAALLFLLFPGILMCEVRAGIEIPSIFTVILFISVMRTAVQKGSLSRYWVAGLLLGVAALVRSEVLLFPLLLLAYFLIAARDWRERTWLVQKFAALGLGALIAMSPWIIRNYVLVHKIILTATVAGVAAQEGLYTCEHVSLKESFASAQTAAGFARAELARKLGFPFVGPYYQLFYTPQAEAAFNQDLLKDVFSDYIKHPELLAGCSARNVLFNFWFLGKTQKTVLLNMLVQIPLLALALAGFVVLWHQELLRSAGIVLMYILYIPLIQAPIIAHARHSMLIVPFLAFLAAVFLVWIWRRFRRAHAESPDRSG